MSRSIRFVLLCALLLACRLPAQAQNPNIPELRPSVVAPFMAKAPSIDGVIGEGEWATSHVHQFVAQRQGGKDVLQARDGEFWLGGSKHALYIAVRTAVHPDVGAVAKHSPEGKKDIGDTIYDDSIELWIHNGPDRPGAKYYQLMVNSLGATFDKMYDTADGSANLYWRPEGLRQAHTVADGYWTAEFMIPWADLEVTNPLEELGLRVCRNYKYAWDQSRWSPKVSAFDSAETMGRLRFAEVAPIVQELGWQSAEGIDVAVRLLNPGDTPLPVRVKLGYNAEQQPRYYDDWSGEIPAGGSVERHYRKDFFTADGYPALAEIRVSSPDGATTYHQRDVKWLTKPGKLWDAVAPKGGDDAVTFDLEWHPTLKILRCRANLAELAKRDEVTSLRVIITTEDGTKTVHAFALPAPRNFQTIRQISLPELADGRYRVGLYLDGEAAAEKPVKTQIFEQRSDFVWLNNDIGRSEEVIPPFTPITVNGAAVDTVLRRHVFNELGLWDQVTADGQELLAAPMTLEVTVDGKRQAIAGKMSFPEHRDERLRAAAEWQAGPLQGKTRAVLDYDGCLKVTLELAPTGEQQVDSLDLVIPLRDEAMPLAHICGDGMRINYGGAAPAGTGTVWTSLKASRSDLAGTFVPYIWLGADGPGLAWFAANDRDWIVDTSDANPAAALERQDGVLTLRIRLIQTPAALTRTHLITFGLMATPTKPMPADWRRAGLFNGGQENVTFLGMCMYWGGQLYGVYPADRDFTVVEKIADANKTGKADTAYFDAYTEQHPGVKAEIRWAANVRQASGIVPYTNIRGAVLDSDEWRVYQDEWRRGTFQWRITDPEQKGGSIDFSIIPVPSRTDFLLWYYREFLRAGLDGIYWDNICLYSNSNPISGGGYVRADGVFQPEADIWQLREVTRRTAVLAHEMGKTNINMPHMTNAALAPVFSWTGYYLGWEWKYGESDWQTRFSREYIRAINTGRQTGNRPGVLEGHTSQISDLDLRAWVQRTRAGVALTHEIIVQMPDPLLAKARAALFAMGYGSDQARVYNYWERQPVATVAGLDSSWLVCDSPAQTLLVLCDWGGGGADGRITLDTQRLGLPADFTAVNWEDADMTQTAANGSFAVGAIKSHDFRIFVIRKQP